MWQFLTGTKAIYLVEWFTFVTNLNAIFITDTWKPNKMGDPSTAGTTASAVIFRQDKIFVANVGDSTVVLSVCVHARS